MNNLYTLLLSGLLICLSGSLSAQMFTVGLTDAEGDVGEEVCIDLVGANFVDVVGMQFTMLFDTSALEFVSASGSINGATVSIVNPSFFPTEIRLSYSPFSSTGFTDEGPFTFGNICFRIKRDAVTTVVIDPDPDLFEYTITTGGSSQTFGPGNASITNGTITGGGGSGATCNDGLQNGDETGVDCGGSCTPCMAMPTCSDGIQNGDETGVDCGGSCSPCPPTPTCTDGVQNGDETGVDCGGSCIPCTTTSMFSVGLTNAAGDVGDEVCLDLIGSNFVDVVGMQFTMLFDTSALEFVSATGSINGATVSIVNPTFFPTEIRLSYSPFSSTGYTDAGPFTFGTICFRIKRGITTVVTIDPDPELFEYTITGVGGSETFGPSTASITNGTITGGGGSTATCSDGIQNGDETGVDCGGSCSPCSPTPTCTDGIQNGDETGVDCGGSCAPCSTTTTCGAGSDLFHLCGGNLCDIAVGSQACIELNVANFTDITAVQLDLLYPGANLDYVSTTAHPSIGTSLIANPLSDGQVRLLFFRSADAPVNLNDGEAFATVCFTNETAGSTTVTLDRPRITSTTTDNIQSVLNDGSVNGSDCGGVVPTCSDGIQNGSETGVDCGGPNCSPCMTGGGDDDCGEGSDRFNLCVSDACDIAVGGQACVDLSVSMFTNVTGFQAKLLFPGANLDYASFNSVHPTLGDGLQINPIGDGEVRLFFFRAADMPVSIPDGESIITVCFTNQTASTTIIDATDLVITDTNGDVIGPIANDGMVNGCSTMGETCSDGIMNNGETGIDCGGPNCSACPVSMLCGEGTTDVDFCVGSVCGDAGAEVCVPVHIGNFNNLGGLQFSLAFTAANLNYTRFIPSPNLAGITVQPPNDMNGNPIDGIVNFIWADLSGVGASFPADEPIVQLCFTVENTNVTPISFRDPATELRAVDVLGTRLPFRLNPGAINQNCGGMETCTDGILNNGETEIDCGGPNCAPCPTNGTCADGILNNGETEIDCGGPNCAPCNSTCGEDTNLLSVCIGEACDVAVGSQACVDLFVGNFDNVTGFQFRVFYPGANLNYASFTSNPALGDPLQVNQFTDGQVRVFFFDSDQGGITLDDGESLGTICFTNELDGPTVLDGQSLVVTNTTGDVIGPVLNDGAINGCSSAPSCTNGIKDGDEEAVDCGGSCPDVCETCDDGIMNGDETGVDCGGSCGPCPTGTVTFTAGSGMAQVGQQVCVNVTVADFVNISNVSLNLGYNSASLSLASVTANSALSGFGPANFTTTTAGQILVSYMPASPQTLTNGEELFEVCFNVTGPDESPLTFTNTTVVDGGGTTLTVNTNNGVINSGGVVVYDGFSLVGGNVTGSVGTEVCVDVNVFNLDGLAGLQFAIDYDETKLEYTRFVGTGELQGIQVASTGGILRVVWFDANAEANSVEDGRSIVSVCFNVLEACETPIEFVEQLPSVRIRASTPEGDLVPVDVFPGSVNAGRSCGPIDSPPNLVLDLGSASGPVGTEVCVDLNVTNFTSLTRLGFTIDHDPLKLTFSRAINFGFPSLTSANIGAPALGRVVLNNWTAPVSTGQSLPAGARLVTLCYIVERLEVAPLNFSNSIVTIQARNANNQNVGVIPSNGTINPDAPTVDGLTFQIGSTSADVNDEICLPVIGFQAIDMVGFQYSISYDPTKLEYIGTGPDYAFDGFNDGAVNNTQPGQLAVVWTSPSAIPQTLGDGRALFSICFRVLSDDLNLVTFTDVPTDIEFENEDGILNASLFNGTVNGTPAPTIVDADIRSPRCESGSDGSIALTVSGGSSLSYQWSPNVSSGAAATGLPAGDYSVTVTNTATSQSTTGSYTVDPGTPFDIEVAEISGITCNGARDGRILIATIGPDTGPYIFDWSGTLPDDGPEQINLDADSYGVTVTNANGCVRSLDNIQIGEPGVLAIAGSPNDILPGGTGGVTIQVNGGSRPFRYSWTGTNGYSSDQEDINDVTEPGTYCLTVTDNNNCTTTQCFAVINALAIVSTSVNVGCAGENSNCSISIEVVGGAGVYDYEWSFDGSPISMDQNLILDDCQYGDYTVRVISGANIITQIVTLEEPTEIIVDATVTSATSGDNGSIRLSPSGGNSPYTFDWGGGVTDQNRDDLTAGEYCVTVTDNSSCSTDTCFTVGSTAVAILEVLTTAPTCSDAADGNIQVALDGGVAPVNVRIVPLDLDSNYTSTTVNIPVPVGSWRVFLTDAQGAQLDTLITVTGPAAISATSTVTSDTEDTGCSGMISLDIEGGTGPYTVAWDNSMSGATISSLCAGDYTPTIIDANGCTFTGETITVGRIDEELVAITDVACADGTEGGIDVTITGGAVPYSFAWRRVGGTDVIADTEDVSGQTAGDYTLTITDATGASLVKNYTIGISAGFSVTTAVTSNYNGFGVSCIGANDGRIVITISGQGSFMYEFLLNDVMVGVDSVLENAAAGIYTVSVIDDGGCEITRMVEITAPPALLVNAELSNVSCGSTSDGSISLAPSGGVPNYTFLWSTGATSPVLPSLGIGDYGVTVTDANGCTVVESFTLTGPEDLTLTLEPTAATDGCNGSVRILPLGGRGPYTYTWPQLPSQGNNPFAEGLCPGEYTVEVTDADGCQTITMTAVVLDRSLPCLDVRRVITPDGDGLNEKFVIFCSDDGNALNNSLQIFNRWGQLVYRANDYDCTDLGGINCFEGETNDGAILPEGPYYYIFEFTSLGGEEMQQRGSLTIIRD